MLSETTIPFVQHALNIEIFFFKQKSEKSVYKQCPEYKIKTTNPYVHSYVQVNQMNAICYCFSVAFPHMLSLGFLFFSLLEKICLKLQHQQCDE